MLLGICKEVGRYGRPSLATGKMTSSQPEPTAPDCLIFPAILIPERSAAVLRSGRLRGVTVRGPGRNRPQPELS